MTRATAEQLAERIRVEAGYAVDLVEATPDNWHLHARRLFQGNRDPRDFVAVTFQDVVDVLRWLEHRAALRARWRSTPN